METKKRKNQSISEKKEAGRQIETVARNVRDDCHMGHILYQNLHTT